MVFHAPTRKNLGVFGAVCAGDGRLVTRREEKFDAMTFGLFLKQLLRHRRRGHKMVVILDNARWHHAKVENSHVLGQPFRFYSDTCFGATRTPISFSIRTKRIVEAKYFSKMSWRTFHCLVHSGCCFFVVKKHGGTHEQEIENETDQTDGQA